MWAFDRGFDYRKLQIAFDAIRRGARFVATNPDPYCPVPGGGLPDCAAVTAAIEACTGTRVEQVVGKSSRVMAGAVLARLAVPADRSRADLARSAVQPEFVLDDLRGLLPAEAPGRRI